LDFLRYGQLVKNVSFPRVTLRKKAIPNGALSANTLTQPTSLLFFLPDGRFNERISEVEKYVFFAPPQTNSKGGLIFNGDGPLQVHHWYGSTLPIKGSPGMHSVMEQSNPLQPFSHAHLKSAFRILARTHPSPGQLYFSMGQLELEEAHDPSGQVYTKHSFLQFDLTNVQAPWDMVEKLNSSVANPKDVNSRNVHKSEGMPPCRLRIS
jgi:hypothetical protein